MSTVSEGLQRPHASGQELLADLTEFIDNMDHYATGGERIPGSGYQNAERVANSGSVASTEKAKRRLSAISSGKLRKLELSPPPESDDDDDDETRAESQARPPTEVLEPEPPILRGWLIWLAATTSKS